MNKAELKDGILLNGIVQKENVRVFTQQVYLVKLKTLGLILTLK